MSHNYKLIYFNGRGRAEMSRLIFVYAGEHYEDKRIEANEWALLKPKTPFGQLPLLYMDEGKVILAQSRAIARYLANEFKLTGKNSLDSAKCDMLIDGYDDLLKNYRPWFLEKDPEKKKETWKKLEVEHIVPFLNQYEKFLTETGTGYFVTDTITWADLGLFDGLFQLRNMSGHLFEHHPKLAQFIDKIASEPKIKAWIEKRPESTF